MSYEEGYDFERKSPTWKVILKGLIVGSFSVLAVFGFFSLFEGKGIHPIGENAVYIAGEACTINTTLSRSGETILADAEQCIKIHESYRLLNKTKTVARNK